MTTKRYPKKKPAKSGKDDPVPVRGPWPDPRSREEISHGDAESDAGEHVEPGLGEEVVGLRAGSAVAISETVPIAMVAIDYDPLRSVSLMVFA